MPGAGPQQAGPGVSQGLQALQMLQMLQGPSNQFSQPDKQQQQLLPSPLHPAHGQLQFPPQVRAPSLLGKLLCVLQ